MVKEVTNSANEIFIMIDADHNGILEPDEVNDFLISIGEKKKNHTHDMNQSQFIQMMLKMNNGKKNVKLVVGSTARIKFIKHLGATSFDHLHTCNKKDFSIF
jgi:hypothetical protein